jgi:predicted nucleotidyltransferase
MIEVTQQILAEMVKAIVRQVDPEQVFLFGSRARDNAKAYSDIDLLIVEKKTFGQGHSRRKEIALIRRALSQFRVAKDILVYNKDEIAKWRNCRNHIISHCLKKGRLLYERQ